MDAFVPYGGLHALALVICAVAIATPAGIANLLDRKPEMIVQIGRAHV